MMTYPRKNSSQASEKKLIALASSAGDYTQFLIQLAEQGELDTLRLLLDDDIGKSGDSHSSFVVGMFRIFVKIPYSSLLRAATRTGQLHVVKYLVEVKKVKIDGLEGSERNVLHAAVQGGQAAKSGNINALDFSAPEPDKDDIGFKDLCYAAARTGDLLGLKSLLAKEHQEFESLPLLYAAVQGGHLNVVRYLVRCRIKHGIYPRSRGKDPQPDLVHIAAEAGYLNILRCLIEEGMEPPDGERHDKDGGRTPYRAGNLSLLHIAASAGHFSVVHYLMCKYQDLHGRGYDKLIARDQNGLTPLLTAIEKGHTEIAIYLWQIMQRRKAFVEETAKGNGGYWMADILWLKIQRQKASIQEKPDPALVEQIQPILKLSQECKGVEAALFKCIRTGDLETIRQLIEMGVDPAIYRLEGKVPLEVAAEAGRLPIVRYLETCRVSTRGPVKPFQYALKAEHETVTDYLHKQYLERALNVESPASDNEVIQKQLLEATRYGSDDVDLVDRIYKAEPALFNFQPLLPKETELETKREDKFPVWITQLRGSGVCQVIIYLLIKQVVNIDDVLPVPTQIDYPIRLRNFLLQEFPTGTTNLKKLVECSEQGKYALLFAKMLAFLNKYSLLDQSLFERILESRTDIENSAECFKFLSLNKIAPDLYLANAVINVHIKTLEALEIFFTIPMSPYAIQYREVRSFARLYYQSQRDHKKQRQAGNHLSSLISVLAQSVASFLMPNGAKLFEAYYQAPAKLSAIPATFFHSNKYKADSYQEGKGEQYSHGFYPTSDADREKAVRISY